MQESTDRFARHAVEATFDDLGPREISALKTFLLDTIGVGVAGSSGAGVQGLIDTAKGWGDGEEATVWVTGECVPAPAAAVVNAYQIHCLEYDCVHEPAVLHPMATLLGAVLPYAERRTQRGSPVSGKDLLVALAVGIDFATLIGEAATGPIRFFRPATAGGLGAAAALARLEGMDVTGVKDTLGAMYAQTSGTLQPHLEGSPMVGLQIGFNARGAISAVDLAGAGFGGAHDVIDGRYGYLVMFEDNRFNLDLVWPKLGREWQVTQLAHKPFPSGRLTHGIVHALMRLFEDHNLKGQDIAKITAHVPPLVYRLVGRPDIPEPAPNYAKLCLPYVAGAWLARGQVDVPEFRSEAVLRDPEIHDYASRVKVIQDDNPDENAMGLQRFTFDLTNGRRKEIVIDKVYGHPDAPLSAAENEAKFRRCVGFGRRTLSSDRMDEIIAAVEHVEDLVDISALARLTVVA